ncbi:MAG: hypothetical protein N2203_06900 [Bacteroidia bacterium]|nr:hypothetical protein [Bacteroidia bacterium]
MIYQRKTNDFPLAALLLLYLLSLVLVWLNQKLQLNKAEYFQHNFFSINIFAAKIINAVFLLINGFLINQIFSRKERHISGLYAVFIYLLVHNKWWLFENLNNYLISDFFILIALFFIRPKEVKKKMNLIVFYLSILFGIEFLAGIHILYSLIIPTFLFAIFLSIDWKSWLIFILGFLTPVYFFITVSWLLDKNPVLFLKAVFEYNSFRLNTFSLGEFSFTGELQWINIGIVILVFLAFLSGLKELQHVNYYSTSDRRLALFFFLLMFFSLINYFLIYVFYHQHAFSIIALPYAYYVGNLLNKTNQRVRYLILFLLFVLTVFL